MKTNEELVAIIAEMLRQSKYQYEIKNYLTKENVDPRDFAGLLEQATKIYDAEKTKKRRIVWISLTILTFCLFYFFIPNSVYNIMPLGVSAIGAIIFTICLIQSFADFTSIEEINSKENDNDTWQRKISPYLVIPGIVILFVFVMHFSSKETTELITYGEKVTGTIIDGNSIKSRRGGTYNVTVAFVTKEGRAVTVTESVGESEFTRISKGQKVDLFYSKKDPSMVELLLSEIMIKKYMQTEEREITPADLITLLTMNQAQVKKSLTKISYGWEYNPADSIWSNNRRSSAIRCKKDKTIKCVAFGNSFMSFPEILKKLGFKKRVTEDKTSSFFESEKYFALTEITMDGSHIGTTITIEVRDK